MELPVKVTHSAINPSVAIVPVWMNLRFIKFIFLAYYSITLQLPIFVLFYPL